MTLIKSFLPLVIAIIVYHLGFLDGVDTFTRLLDSLVIAVIIVASADRLFESIRQAVFPQSEVILTPEKPPNAATPIHHDNAITDQSTASAEKNDIVAPNEPVAPNEIVAPTRQLMSPIATHLTYEESDNVSALMLSPRPTMSFSTPLRRHTMDEWMPPTPQLSPSLSMSSTNSTKEPDLIRLRRSSRVEEMIKQFDRPKRASYRRYSIGGMAEPPKPLIRTRTFGFKPIIGVWEKRIELEEKTREMMQT
ncbi:hypothetical protein BJV82DRAFT_581880 [Fennellomyces sp. T-0311]|nr:hypothetical protein BJV82DRAFT_581880 [Fennellomyces sp. T-0311]